MQLMKCQMAPNAEMSLQYGKSWSRQLGAGSVIDFDEKVGGKVEAVTDEKGNVLEAEHERAVRDLLRGREDLFVPVEAPAPEKSKVESRK